MDSLKASVVRSGRTTASTGCLPSANLFTSSLILFLLSDITLLHGCVGSGCGTVRQSLATRCGPVRKRVTLSFRSTCYGGRALARTLSGGDREVTENTF